MSRRRNKKYSVELKLQAVQDYLNGGGSSREISKKYGIRDKRQLLDWTMWYNGHKEFKERRGARTEIYMTKGRKTTLNRQVFYKYFAFLEVFAPSSITTKIHIVLFEVEYF